MTFRSGSQPLKFFHLDDVGLEYYTFWYYEVCNSRRNEEDYCNRVCTYQWAICCFSLQPLRIAFSDPQHIKENIFGNKSICGKLRTDFLLQLFFWTRFCSSWPLLWSRYADACTYAYLLAYQATTSSMGFKPIIRMVTNIGEIEVKIQGKWWMKQTVNIPISA